MAKEGWQASRRYRCARRTLHARTTVQRDGKVKVASPEPGAGRTVDVVMGSTDYHTKYGVVWDADLEGVYIGGNGA